MSDELDQEYDGGMFESPGGFVFGIQGWSWGEQRPTSITFLLEGHAVVSDQHGRPIKGAVIDGKPLYFSRCSHAETVAALLEENIDVIDEMNKLGAPCKRCNGTKRTGDLMCHVCKGTGLLQVMVTAGWPQLPYDQLKRIKNIPPTPIDELRKIKNPEMRRDALRMRREVDEAYARELSGIEEE